MCQMTYAVRTVENLFTWYGHKGYSITMEINQSKNHTWKVTNIIMYCKCDTPADVHIHIRTHTEKKAYMCIYSHINCGTDKKNQ